MANREEIIYERNSCVKDMDYDIYGFAIIGISNVMSEVDGKEIVLRSCLRYVAKDPNKNIDHTHHANPYAVLYFEPVGCEEYYFKNASIVDAIKTIMNMHPEYTLEIFKQIPTGIFEDKAVIREILDMIPIHEHSEVEPYIEVIRNKRNLIDMSKHSKDEIVDSKRTEIKKAYDKTFKK